MTKANSLLSDIEIITEDQASIHSVNPWETEEQIITDIILSEIDETYLSFEEFMDLKHTLTNEALEFYKKLYKNELKNFTEDT